MNTTEQLQQINNAITAIEIGGQEYQIGTRRLRRADLSLLYKQRKELQAQLESEQTDGAFLTGASVVNFDRR